MKKLRIFISSLGDVKQERMIAKKVISDLDKIYQDYVRLEAILWEDLPLEATGSFQNGIDYFLHQAPIDIAVFILWSRLGSALGNSYLRPDGTVYASGTEYEFDMMYTLWGQTGHPKIMVYIKNAEPMYGSGLTSSDFKELLDQKDKVENFIEEKFHDRETGTNYAYWQFDKQQTFEERLRVHLTRLIREQIGGNVSVREWQGNPYVGLKSYDMNESAIFCGRKGLVYDIVGKLLSQSEKNESPTLFVLGESGSGKSSLIKAGVLPQLLSESDDNTNFRVEIMTPSAFRGHVYDGLVETILRYYPMGGNPVAADLRKGIPDNYDFKYLQYALMEDGCLQKPIFFIDQFEELFTDNLITADERKRSLQLLRGLAETRQLLLILSMRNDFYNRFTSYPELGLIKNLSIMYDIPNVSVADITEIVEEPARKANLHWERNGQGMSLSKKIVEDATSLQSLPLIEFGLSELYKECAATEELTFEAYQKIGFLKGAVIQYANNFYNSLSEQEQAVFRGLLGALVTVSNGDETLFVRKVSVRKNLEKTQVHKSVIQKLIDAHLLVADKDAQGNPTVAFVHEILLNSWSVVSDWIERHQKFLSENDHYENLARYWKDNGCQGKDLIQERSALLEGEYFLFQHEKELQPATLKFLDKSLARQRRKGLVKHIFCFICLLFLAMCSSLIFLVSDDMDSDLVEFFDLGSFSMYDFLSGYVPILLVSINAIYLRIRGKCKYKTIFSSVVFWSVILFVVVPLNIYEIITNRTECWAGILWILPFFVCWVSVFYEYQRRKLWKRSIYRPYLIADRFDTIKNIIIWCLIGMVGLLCMVAYGVILQDKNERYENTLSITDELFDGLNNISNQLSWSDKYYINAKRMDYLVDRFSEELSDTIPDEREFEFATCLYNLYEPYEALGYLYPGHYWHHYCLSIMACMKAGLFSSAESALEQYVDSGRTSDLKWVTPTTMIWTAEELGRFDLADKIYNAMEEENVSWNASDVVNFGHILLMRGDIDGAINKYQEAKDLIAVQNPEMEESAIERVIEDNLNRDFSIFRWLSVGNQSYVDDVSRRLGIHIRDYFTTVADSGTTEKIHDKLKGDWALEDSSIVISIHQEVPICQCKFFSDNNEIYRALTYCRFSKYNGHVYWEEWDQDTETIYTGEIVALSERKLTIRIIENGDDDSKGMIREYYRVPADE